MDMKSRSMEEVCTLISRPAPAPAAVSACALSAALAAALASKLFGLALNRGNQAAQPLLKQSEALMNALLDDVQRDADAYSAYVRAKAAEPDEGYQQHLEDALAQAIEVPLAAADRAAQVMALLKQARQLAPKSAVSDAQSALLMAQAAAKGSLVAARVNCHLLGQGVAREAFIERIEEVQERVGVG